MYIQPFVANFLYVSSQLCLYTTILALSHITRRNEEKTTHFFCVLGVVAGALNLDSLPL